MLFLGAITTNQGLSQHLNLLNHRLLLQPLQIALIPAQTRLVLRSYLGQKLFHEIICHFFLCYFMRFLAL